MSTRTDKRKKQKQQERNEGEIKRFHDRQPRTCTEDYRGSQTGRSNIDPEANKLSYKKRRVGRRGNRGLVTGELLERRRTRGGGGERERVGDKRLSRRLDAKNTPFTYILAYSTLKTAQLFYPKKYFFFLFIFFFFSFFFF